MAKPSVHVHQVADRLLLVGQRPEDVAAGAIELLVGPTISDTFVESPLVRPVPI
jgi:hypothetical protein